MNPFQDSALNLRSRSVWEAADSGVLLWRSNFYYFLPFFAIPVWVTAGCLRLLPANFYYLSYIILWWLKPLFDRLVLHVISLRFFDSQAPLHFKELRKGLTGSILRGLPGDLLWRRFSPSRGSRMPIRVLERAKGKQYKLRKTTLASGGLNFCILPGTVSLIMELMLLLGEVSFVIMAAQLFHPSALGYMQDNLKTLEIVIFATYCLNYILVESLYVCMGFGIYINSRVEVEGWDLQLLFQKFASPKADAPGAAADQKNPGSVIKTILLVCLVSARLFMPIPLAAEQEDTTEPTLDELKLVGDYFPDNFSFAPEESLKSLNEILASPDFGSEKEGWRIKFKYSPEPKEIPDIKFPPWLEKLKYAFSITLRFIAVTAVASLAVFAMYWFYKLRRESWLRRSGKNYTSAYQNPHISFLSPEALFTKAEDFFNRGFTREAWAACFSGYLAAYTKYHSLSFPADATEYGCLAVLREALPNEEKRFGDLVQTWILLAYGGISPANGAFENALASGNSIGTAPIEIKHEP